MKIHKTISIDMDLIEQLNARGINVSEACNTALKELINLPVDDKDSSIIEAKNKFLANMSTNIMTAKDNKKQWEKLFGSKKDWSELLALKAKYGKA